jgi:hypothetical protein
LLSAGDHFCSFERRAKFSEGGWVREKLKFGKAVKKEAMMSRMFVVRWRNQEKWSLEVVLYIGYLCYRNAVLRAGYETTLEGYS